jgi:hypothetical protein
MYLIKLFDGLKIKAGEHGHPIFFMVTESFPGSEYGFGGSHEEEYIALESISLSTARTT